ncbi:CRISPR-associated protein Cas1 [Lewinella aquimaris]|uniref:CRISPR-associated endonuclease Cas1 n=1 Tax=Neolewinella aquimaris TaxID=1835722 RepID=A0A840E3G9_9BACT|nr:CRISPR-associated endonuclease Cas1 [Neolewinella aquimaris]MBB4079751.1 CRISPR-associated protein Cas1 [Neolewinella aquimaris]
MQLVLNTHGLSLKVKDGLFRVSHEDEVRDISPEQLSSISVTSPCLLSSAAIRLAAESEVPIYFFDRFGDADACLRSPYFESLATLRRKQVYFSDSKAGTAWVIRQFGLKTAGQLENLKYLANRRRKREEELHAAIKWIDDRLKVLQHEHDGPPTDAWSASIMGWEGNTARIYWGEVGQAVPEAWQFSGRSRRPALDAYNALTNYFYGMLYATVERALFNAGLDPHLGVLHADEYDRPTLAYDLIEPFRPWVDRFILEQLFVQKLLADVVEPKDAGFWLNSTAKRTLIPAFNEWMRTPRRWEGRQMSRDAHIFRHAAGLARLIDLIEKRPV